MRCSRTELLYLYLRSIKGFLYQGRTKVTLNNSLKFCTQRTYYGLIKDYYTEVKEVSPSIRSVRMKLAKS